MLKILVVVVIGIFITGFVVNQYKNKEDVSGGVIQSGDKEEMVVEQVNKGEEEKNDGPIISSNVAIDLSGQGLTKVPQYIFDKINTQKLDLSNNKLNGSLQAEVRHLQNLKILDLSNNQFTGIPAEIGQLKSLEILDLSNNQITGLPYELGNLTNLKVLNLKGNTYAGADLIIIKQSLPASTIVQVD